jgi:hypothetical protein
MIESYEAWLGRVRDALSSINMPLDQWQAMWPFEFRAEFETGADADAVAMKANRFWWRQQNRSLKQDCRVTPDCWLPRGHQGECQPVAVQERRSVAYERGDYVKVEFPDETTGIGEWMWVRVVHCDDEKQMVFGTLDNEPVGDYGGKVGLGSELAVSYSQIRDHRKSTEFKTN